MPYHAIIPFNSTKLKKTINHMFLYVMATSSSDSHSRQRLHLQGSFSSPEEKESGPPYQWAVLYCQLVFYDS